MQVESIIKPSKYSIENLENGKVAVSFFDNITEQIQIFEEKKLKKYLYNAYKIILNNRENLMEDIQNNYQNWLQFAKDIEYEKLATEIRNKRDKLLIDTDWTQVIDSALTAEKQEEYKMYRQELRDITEQEDFPYSIVFPTKPQKEI